MNSLLFKRIQKYHNIFVDIDSIVSTNNTEYMSFSAKVFKFDDETICFTSGRYNKYSDTYNKTYLGKFNYNTNEIYWTETNIYNTYGKYSYSGCCFNTNKILILGGTSDKSDNINNTYSIGTYDKINNSITWKFLENNIYLGGNVDTLFINDNFYTFDGFQYSMGSYIYDIYKGVYDKSNNIIKWNIHQTMPNILMCKMKHTENPNKFIGINQCNGNIVIAYLKSDGLFDIKEIPSMFNYSITPCIFEYLGNNRFMITDDGYNNFNIFICELINDSKISYQLLDKKIDFVSQNSGFLSHIKIKNKIFLIGVCGGTSPTDNHIITLK